jgi:chromosome segregation ATPase
MKKKRKNTRFNPFIMITKKKIITAYACVLCIGFFTSCVEKSTEYRKLQTENDSLKLQIKKTEVEIEEMLSILDAIESDFSVIRETEKIITIQQNSELTGTKRQQVERNMSLIVETLKRNREQLAELQEKLNASNLRVTSMQNTIERLTKDVNEKTELIAKLQEDLNRKDVKIKVLSAQVEDLSGNVEVLKELTETQSAQISKQQKSLYTVYYCFGSKK